MNLMTRQPMKQLLLLTTLCATLACQAAEPASPVAAAGKETRSRCPTLPRLNFAKMPSGNLSFVVRFLIKADGSVENVRIEGKRAKDIKRIVMDAFNGYRCLPGEADQESTMTFGVKETSY
ncbi:hypothetical protein [Roseateles sp. LYH14W]|uniref:TonB C-terminal domain-containing protein n=1 Tax=Pelomonas parva TaxID=3299032 RepID=A0ABW7F176_9BURK